MDAKRILRAAGLGLVIFSAAMSDGKSLAQSPLQSPVQSSAQPPAQPPAISAAAKIVRVVPVQQPDAAIRARALAPTPNHTLAPETASPKTGSSWIHGPVPTTISPRVEQSAPFPARAPEPDRSSFLNPDANWEAFKNFLRGTKSPSQNAASSALPLSTPSTWPSVPTDQLRGVYQASDQTPQGIINGAAVNAKMAYQPSSMTTASPRVYAGPPAYRWYGYGTTTPGRNPHAPTGESPRGSGAWYAQTGATPGAFPVTVQTTTPPSFTAGPPTYPQATRLQPLVATPFDADRRVATVLPPSSLPQRGPMAGPFLYANQAPPLPPGAVVLADGIPAGQPIPNLPQLPPPTFGPPTVLGTSQPIISAPPPSFLATQPANAPAYGAMPPPFVMPSTMMTNPANTSPAAPATVNPPPDNIDWRASRTVARPQAPQDRPTDSIEALMRSAAEGNAKIELVQWTGLSQVQVRLRAASLKQAEAAVNAISRIPSLKPYQIDFEMIGFTPSH